MRMGSWNIFGNAIDKMGGRRQMALNALPHQNHEESLEDGQSLEQLQLMALMLENEADMVAGD
tara:strand:- start:720 stop:908 length:189 start_codon:yes stop_codon:yes gene_type:complete